MTFQNVNVNRINTYDNYSSNSFIPLNNEENVEESIFSGVDGFDNWSNSETPQDDFKMFDINLSTYSKDLKDFAQSYIDKYDADGDSSLSFNEFVTMASNGQANAESLSEANDLYTKSKDFYQNNIVSSLDANKDGALEFDEYITAFGYDSQTISAEAREKYQNEFNYLNTDNFEGNENQLLSADELLVGINPKIQNIDSQYLQSQSDMYNMFNSLQAELDIDGDGQINSSEWATNLYTADLDWGNYAVTGDIASSLDGKLNWENYQTMPLITEGMDGYNVLRQEKEDFYNNFYAESEPTVSEQKGTKVSKSDLPDGYQIVDNQIMDKDGNVIGRTEVSYVDLTNDGVKDKVTSYILND